MSRSLILVLAACSSSSPPTSPPSNSGGSSDTAVWSDAVGGLRVRFELPDSVKRSPPANGGSQPVEVTMHVRNVTDHRIRILLVRPEVFRLFTSTLRVWQRDLVVSLQPDPHPHGYLLTEEDFVLIEPRADTTFKQTLYLSGDLANPGAYTVEWMFENATKRWPGGAQTLDGITKPLFGGADVPDLWTGKISTKRRLQID